ncbi:MAG: hypothetical protein H5T99_13115 [Moorella sp. (in: Bacteria)]|nr:hypothetical protein [Moorella sp. (in: firmicutes)]
MLHILGGHTREDMAIVMAALKRGLPPSPDVLHSLQAFIAGAQGGGQHGILRLPGFIPFLAGLLAEQGGKEVRASHLYRQVLINLAALLLKPEEGAAKVMEQLRSLLAAQFPGGGEKGRGDAGQNYLPENTGSTTSRASGFNNLLAGFKLLLQEARESAGGSGRAAAGSSDQAILGEGEEIARQIAGQHLWQLPPKEGEGPDYLYFLLPLRQDGAVTEWGQLVIKKDSKGRGLIDPRDFSMTILLRTENLGPLLLDIKVWQKEIRVQGQVQEEWVGRLISKSWPALQDAFAGLGYHLHSYQWQAVPLIPGLLSRLLEPSPAGVPGLLDERV